MRPSCGPGCGGAGRAPGRPQPTSGTCYLAAMSSSDSPWWAERYSRLLAVDRAFGGEIDGLAEEQADFIERLAALRPGERILDLGCGAGRHSILLAERGYRVVGLDLSADLLAEARAAWARRHPDQPGPTWVQADMRRPDLDGAHEACIAMDHSLGMFDDDADHLEVLVAVGDRLSGGGPLILELMNPYFWAHHAETRHYPPGALAADAHIVRSYRFDADRGRIEDHVTVFRTEGPPEVMPVQSLRAWTPPEIRALLSAAGFQDVEVYGSDGWRAPTEPRPLDPVHSAWMWVRARSTG